MNHTIRYTAGALVLLLMAGCTGKQKIIDQQILDISVLEGEVRSLEQQISKERGINERLNNQLRTVLAEYEENEQVLLDKVAGRSIVTVSDGALFQSGGTTLTSSGRDILDRIAGVFDTYPDRELLVEGHTDNVQIKQEFQSKFRSNWELSSARAHSALHYLNDRYEVLPSRMAAVGYGEHRPIADNSTPDGRAANRRVVIVIGPVLEGMESVRQAVPMDQPIP